MARILGTTRHGILIVVGGDRPRYRSGMARLIAEDLLLLLLDDERGTPATGADLGTVLGGAVLIELALDGAVHLTEKTSVWRRATVVADPAADETDPVLRRALQIVAAKDRPAQDLIERLGKGVRAELTERLTAARILERREGRVLWVFPRTTWPTLDVSPEQQLRRTLAHVLVEGAEPDPRTAALVSMLHAVGQAQRVVPHEGVSSREVRRRAKQVAEGSWAADAVRGTVAATNAAVMAAVVAATVATTAGTGA